MGRIARAEQAPEIERGVVLGHIGELHGRAKRSDGCALPIPKLHLPVGIGDQELFRTAYLQAEEADLAGQIQGLREIIYALPSARTHVIDQYIRRRADKPVRASVRLLPAEQAQGQLPGGNGRHNGNIAAGRPQPAPLRIDVIGQGARVQGQHALRRGLQDAREVGVA